MRASGVTLGIVWTMGGVWSLAACGSSGAGDAGLDADGGVPEADGGGLEADEGGAGEDSFEVVFDDAEDPGDAVDDAEESGETGGGCDPGRFPDQTLDFFDAADEVTGVHPDARGFQLAVYDPRGRRAIFIPWGGFDDEPLCVLLGYHTDEPFLDASSYEAIDLCFRDDPLATPFLDRSAQGFAGGFIDDDGNWLYFVPFRRDLGDGVEPNGLAVRFDMTKDLSDRSAYETFDVTTIPSPPDGAWIGWVAGAYAGGFAFYMPMVEPHDGSAGYLPHGQLLRYDAARAFDDPSAWELYDLHTHVHRKAWGFQSNAVKMPWLYLVPYAAGNTVLVRYDVTRPFQEASSYETVDLALLNDEAKGYTGAVVVGDSVVLVPWRWKDAPDPREQSMYTAAVYDTREPLTDAAAWSFFDLRTVDAGARGYQFGWLDADELVHFVPAFNSESLTPPPFVVWDSRMPFADACSWEAYPSDGVPPSTGAAYDGTWAYLAPYGMDGDSGLITRVGTR
jgi:hypothetical protein